jgi:hypothetical protein
VRRFAHASAAVLLAGAAAGIEGSHVPFTGAPAQALGIRGSEHPIAVFQTAWQWLEATPALGLEALILGLAAGSLVLATRGADLTIAAFVGCFLGGTLLAAPEAAAFPFVATGWITYLALTLMSRRQPEHAARRRSPGALLRSTKNTLRAAFLGSVGKPLGFPRPLPRVRAQRGQALRAGR